MRTTLTLDDDVAVLLRRLQKQRGLRFKELVNEALRVGIQRMEEEPRPAQPFRTRSVDLGKCLLDNLDCIGEVLAVIEGEDFK